MFFINLIYWLWLFIITAGLWGFIGFWLFKKSSENLAYLIIVSIIGVVLGVLLAEHVRKKYGLDNFFGRLISTPDMDAFDKDDDPMSDSSKK